MKIYSLIVLVFLTGCCMEENEGDCTAEELAQIKSDRTPVLISTQGNILLYRMNDHGTNVYFTTPCGDTSYDEHIGKTIYHHQVNGAGCQ